MALKLAAILALPVTVLFYILWQYGGDRVRDIVETIYWPWVNAAPIAIIALSDNLHSPNLISLLVGIAACLLYSFLLIYIVVLAGLLVMRFKG